MKFDFSFFFPIGLGFVALTTIKTIPSSLTMPAMHACCQVMTIFGRQIMDVSSSRRIFVSFNIFRHKMCAEAKNVIIFVFIIFFIWKQCAKLKKILERERCANRISPRSYDVDKMDVNIFYCYHEGSHREVYRDFQPSLTSSAGGAKGCSDHRFRAPPAYTAQLPTLHQHRANNQRIGRLIKSCQL